MIFSLFLLAHWMGDFALQSSTMALQKSHSMKWLTLHILAYSCPILLCSLVLFSWQLALTYAGINAVLHFITDFFTSKWAAKHRDTPRKFFPILGIDQLIHVLCLLWTLLYLYGDIGAELSLFPGY